MMTETTRTKIALLKRRRKDVTAAERRESDLIVIERANDAGEVILDKSGGPTGRLTAAALRNRLSGYDVRHR